MRSDPVFSAPIAAVHVRGATVVAGLVVEAHAVRVLGFVGGWGGPPSWFVDAIADVAWAPDAAVTLQRAGEGVALAWRGGKGQVGTGTLVFVGPNGQLRGPPQSVGADWCSTAVGAAWVVPSVHGPVRVESRAWSESAVREVFTAADDRAVSLVCAERAVFVLAEGDDDLAVASFVPGAARAGASVTVLRGGDFGDDEAEHRAFTIGDDLAILRVSDHGVASVRRVPVEGAFGPWRRWKHAFTDDDEIAAVDGDSRATVVIYTRASSSRCAGGPTESARALRVDAASGEESVVELAPAVCERALGPFWIAAVPGSDASVAWIERTAQAGGVPPVTAIGYRSAGRDDRAGRLEIHADGVENAGCDDDGCFAAALARPGPDRDAMQPMAVTIVRYR